MNTDTLDRKAYRAWWEAEGRGDLSVCPCGEPAVGDLIPSGHGLCPRHRFDLSGANRERFAQWIIDGTFAEQDLTDAEADRAQLVADGFVRGGPN